MKSTLFSIILFFATGIVPVFCQDFLVAKVQEMDSAKLKLTVKSTAIPATEYTVRIAVENDLPRESGRTVFPECVATGETVRLWGHAEDSDDSLFIANDIRGCRHGGCSDPTGVRSRLSKVQQYEQNGEDADDWDFDFGRGMGGHGNEGGRGGGTVTVAVVEEVVIDDTVSQLAHKYVCFYWSHHCGCLLLLLPD